MATSYPTSIDSFTTHIVGDVVDPAFDNNQQDAIVALETKVGVTGSAVNTTLDYKTANITGGDRAIGASQTVTVTNKKISDTTNTFVAAADTTKGVQFLVGGTTGIVSFFATIFTAIRTITFPDATTTLMGKDTTDVMTNKSFDTAGTGNFFRIAGTIISAITGTGSAVLATSPTITTPTITKPVMNATNPTAQTYSPAAAATATLDLALGNQHDITMPVGNITIALTNDTNNQIFTVSILQDGTGSRTVTWFSTIRWANGTVPVLTTTASKRDMFIFKRTGSGTYDGFIVGQNI